MRAGNEIVAVLADAVGGVAMLAFLSLLATSILALLWYFYPRWLPRNWSIRLGGGRRTGRRERLGGLRLGALRWRFRLRWRRRRRSPAPATVDLPPDSLPELPAEVLVLSADQLAAQGRYGEAVRERLRAIVRDLVERDVIPPSPGWTVTELARAATLARPALAAPLAGAVATFSEIWYGLRPALADDDAAMRAHATAVSALVAGSPTGTAAPPILATGRTP